MRDYEDEDFERDIMPPLRAGNGGIDYENPDEAEFVRVPRKSDSGLDEWDAGDDTDKPSPRGWLLGNSFCRRFISSLIADGGVGKTAVRYAEALSLAIGRSLTGEHVFNRSRVLIVSLEDDDTENAQRGRGASALVDAGRLCYTLTPMSPEEAKTFGIPEEMRRQHIRLDKAKVNLVPAGAATRWFKLVGVKLDNATALYPNGDEIQVAEPWTPKGVWADLGEDLLNQILNEINTPRLLPAGHFYTRSPNAGDRAVVPLVRRRTRKTEDQAKEIVKTWIRNGVLVEFEYRNPETRKDVKGLRVEFGARPGEGAPTQRL